MPTERAIKEDRSREKNEVLVRRKRNQTPVLLPCRCSFSFSARAFINYVFAHRQHACERRWEVKRRRERRNGRKRKCRKKLCAIIPQLLEISVSINLVSCTIRFFRDSSRLFLPSRSCNVTIRKDTQGCAIRRVHAPSRSFAWLSDLTSHGYDHCDYESFERERERELINYEDSKRSL